MPSSGMPHRVAHIRADVSKCSVLRLLITAKVFPSSPVFITLIMEAIRSSETSVLRRPARRNILEDGTFSHGRENHKSYM
jgi:hypothetical protein